MRLDIRRGALALLLLPMLVTACGSHASAARSPSPAPADPRGGRPLAQLNLIVASDPVLNPDGKEVDFTETLWSIGEDESRRGRSDVGPTSGSLQVVDLDGRALRHATLDSLPEWPTHVTTCETWLVDPDSGTFEAHPEYRHAGREDWHAPWMIPRVAEAFALWSR